MRREKGGSLGKYAGAAVCLAAALWAATGCEEKASKKGSLTENEVKRLTLAQKPDQPDHLIVCGETITWEDVLATLPEDSGSAPPLKERLEKAAQGGSLRLFLEEARPTVQQRVNSKISNVVLAQRAARDLGKKEKFEDKLNEIAEQKLREFVLQEHGGNEAEADEALHKLGMNRATYKQWKKREALVWHLVDSKYERNRPITYSELQERYEEMRTAGKFVVEAVLQWRLIDIQVDKLGLKYPQEDASRKARQLAGELRKRLDAGADFAELAKKNSDGPHSEEGGLWPARDPNALAAPYDVLAQKVANLTPGQVAGPIEASGHVFLIKVEKNQTQRYRPLDEVQEEVRRDILKARWDEVSDELDAEVRRQVDAAPTERFVDYCLERFYREAHKKGKG